MVQGAQVATGVQVDGMAEAVAVLLPAVTTMPRVVVQGTMAAAVVAVMVAPAEVVQVILAG